MRGQSSAKLPAAIAALALVLLGTPCHTWVPPDPEDLDGIFLLQPGPYTPPFELMQGDSHDHHINVTFNDGEPFDVNLVLDVISGDADLHVIGPIADSDGVPAIDEPLIDRKSVHYTGSEIMFLSRDDIQAAGMGIYRITIKGYKVDNEYALTIEYTSTERRPPPEEQQVLEDIYNTCCSADVCLDLAPFVQASGYGTVENFCHAPYQSCDKDGRILALRLPGQGLDCMLPESVGNLTYLQRLDLENNYIFGEVGSLFSTLESVPLHSLHLALNYLGGKLPCLPTAADVPLSGLAYIDLAANGIGNEIEACFFTPALEIVNIRGNFLTGIFPKTLPSSTKMLHLDISWQDEQDQLTGELPDFTVWPNLEHLNVARNGITGSFPVLPDSLVVVRLHENKIEGGVPSNLGQFPRLMMLDVANNQLSGPLPETVPDSLESLQMTENQFSGPIPGMEWFGHYEGPRGLQELRLGGNRLTGLIPPELGQLGKLWALDLRNNLLEGSLDIFVEGIDDGNQLVALSLADNNITGTIPEGISKLHSFQDDYEPPPYWEDEKAAVFDISNNKLEGQIPAALLEAAAEEDRELRFEISGNSLECPQEYLGIFGGHETVEFELADGLKGTTCIDRSGNTVLLSEDQAKQRPGNLIWDDALEEWVQDLDNVPAPGSWDYTDDDDGTGENEETDDEDEDADDVEDEAANDDGMEEDTDDGKEEGADDEEEDDGDEGGDDVENDAANDDADEGVQDDTDDGEEEGADGEEEDDDVNEEAADADAAAAAADDDDDDDDGDGTGGRENLTDEVLEDLSPNDEEDVILSGRDLDSSTGTQKEGSGNVPTITVIIVIAAGCVLGIAAVVGAAVAGVYWHRRKTGQAYRDYNDSNGLAMTAQEPAQDSSAMASSDPPPEMG